jgi:hypothetical protein
MRANKALVWLALFLLILIGLISLSSCNKQISNSVTTDIRKDSTSKIETLKIDTLYIPMPADTFRLEVPIDCPDQKIKVIDNKITTSVSIKDRILTIQRDSKKDSLRYVLAYKESSEYKESTKAKEVVKETVIIKKVIPKWCWWYIGISLALIAWLTKSFWLKIFA